MAAAQPASAAAQLEALLAIDERVAADLDAELIEQILEGLQQQGLVQDALPSGEG